MSNIIEVTGNMGENPTLENTAHGPVVHLRMLCDEYKAIEGDGGKTEYVADEAKQEWYSISIWRDGLRDQVMKLLRKGMRITVQGRLTVGKFEDRDNGEMRYALQVNASSLFLNLNRVEYIEMRAKRQPDSPAGARSSAQEDDRPFD